MRELKTSEVQAVSGGLFGLFGWGRRSYGYGSRRSYHGGCGRRSYRAYSCARPTYRYSRCGW